MSASGTLLATSLDNIVTSVDTIGGEAGYSTAVTIPIIVGKIISILLGLLGLVFLILVVYAGFLYLTAQGEDAQVKKAKAILTKAAIGMMLVLSSYAITNVVVELIDTVTAPAAVTPE